MVINKYIDAAGNRALSMVTLNVPLVGEQTCNTYMDFNNRRLVKSVPAKDFCDEIDLKEDFNLKQYIDKLKCEKAGITKYLGTRTVRWETTRDQDAYKQYHAFRIDEDNFDMRRSHVFYFDIKTNELAWIEMVRPLPFIFKIENGLTEREFTDEDFKDVLTECPRRNKGHSQIHEAFNLI
jgi:hypothetical protein